MTAHRAGQAASTRRSRSIGVYDPYLHYSVFNGIVGVLTEKAAKVFRFEEQNQLHEEIIDTGLAQIYQSHLDVAEQMAPTPGVERHEDAARRQGVPEGPRPRAQDRTPGCWCVGRIGVHSPADETGLGSNTENLLRRCPCDVLLTTALAVPRARRAGRGEHPLDAGGRGAHEARAAAWSRASPAPAILRLAVEKGHSVITNSVIDEAMDRFMPQAGRAT